MIQIVVWIVLIIKLLHLKTYGLLYVGPSTEVYIIYVIVLRNIMSGLSLAKLLRWHFVQLGCALFSFWALTWENAIPLSTWWKHYLEEWPFGPHCCKKKKGSKGKHFRSQGKWPFYCENMYKSKQQNVFGWLCWGFSQSHFHWLGVWIRETKHTKDCLCQLR